MVDFADWCVIDVVDDANDLRRVAVARGATTSPNGARVPADEPEAEVRAVLEQRPHPHPPGPRRALERRARVVPRRPRGALGRSRSRCGRASSGSACSRWRGRNAGRRTRPTTSRSPRTSPRGSPSRSTARGSTARSRSARTRPGCSSTSPTAILLLDRHGVVRLWNPAAEAITFIAADDVVGRAAADAIPGWKTAVERVPVSASPDPGHDEVLIPIETSRGERWIAISGVRFFGGTVYAFRDLTDARRLEEIKADFIATASHELRTPLAAVYGAAQTLLRHDFALDETGRERFVSLIADESERLGRIVNEILLANQLDAGQARPRIRAVRRRRPRRARRRGDARCTRRRPSRSRSRRPRACPRSPPTPTRSGRCSSTSSRTRSSTRPTAAASRSASRSTTASVRFRVRDEGLGVAPEDQERIFEKFYRADPQMTRGVGGTGLGLYICRELIDRMGGRIWVEPNGDKGSTFVFELPTADVHGARAAPAPAATIRISDIRGRPGFDVVGSPAELQAEVPGRPPKTTGTQRKCEEHKRTRSRCLTRSEARRSELGPWLG